MFQQFRRRKNGEKGDFNSLKDDFSSLEGKKRRFYHEKRWLQAIKAGKLLVFNCTPPGGLKDIG